MRKRVISICSVPHYETRSSSDSATTTVMTNLLRTQFWRYFVQLTYPTIMSSKYLSLIFFYENKRTVLKFKCNFLSPFFIDHSEPKGTIHTHIQQKIQFFRETITRSRIPTDWVWKYINSKSTPQPASGHILKLSSSALTDKGYFSNRQ